MPLARGVLAANLQMLCVMSQVALQSPESSINTSPYGGGHPSNPVAGDQQLAGVLMLAPCLCVEANGARALGWTLLPCCIATSETLALCC